LDDFDLRNVDFVMRGCWCLGAYDETSPTMCLKITQVAVILVDWAVDFLA